MVKVTSKFVHTTPRKVRFILDAVRGLPVEVAENKLRFLQKQSARDVYTLLHSARSAAKEQGLVESQLVIAQAFCDDGPRIKRRILSSRGRARPINKHMSHITIVVSAGKSTSEAPKTAAAKPEETKEK